MVMPETSGNYTCIVENEAGVANYTYKINVLSRPNILEIDEHLTNEISKNMSMNNVYEIMVALGEPVDVNCLADGHPQPDVISFVQRFSVLFSIKSLNSCVGLMEA